MTPDIVAAKHITCPRDHYVYIHLKADTLEPFYIGKGQKDRAWHSSPSKRERWWRSVKAKHGCIVRIIQDGLQEWAALELEIEMIALYGRKDEGAGPLINLTDGGDGTCGAVVSKELAERRGIAISKSLKKLFAEGHQNSFKGRKHTEETKAKQAAIRRAAPRTEGFKAQTGRGFADCQDKCHTPEVRAKVSATRKRKFAAGELLAHNQRAVVRESDGMVFSALNAACRFLQDNGYPKATHSGIRTRLTGERQSPIYGSTWKYAGM